MSAGATIARNAGVAPDAPLELDDEPVEALDDDDSGADVVVVTGEAVFGPPPLHATASAAPSTSAKNRAGRVCTAAQ